MEKCLPKSEILTKETLKRLSKTMLNANTSLASGQRIIHPDSNLLISKYTHFDPVASTVQQTASYTLRTPISLSPPSKQSLKGDSDAPALVASDWYRAQPDDFDPGTHVPHQHADGLSSHFCKGKRLFLFASKRASR